MEKVMYLTSTKLDILWRKLLPVTTTVVSALTPQNKHYFGAKTIFFNLIFFSLVYKYLFPLLWFHFSRKKCFVETKIKTVEIKIKTD